MAGMLCMLKIESIWSSHAMKLSYKKWVLFEKLCLLSILSLRWAPASDSLIAYAGIFIVLCMYEQAL